MLFSCSYKVFEQHSIAGSLFLMSATVTAVMFIRVATKWRSVMMFWEKNETVFLREPYKQSARLRRKIIASGVVLFLIGLGKFVDLRLRYSLLLTTFNHEVEHALAKASGVYGYNAEAVHCNDTVQNRFRYYASREYYHIFKVFGYHPSYAIIFWASSTSTKRVSTMKSVFIHWF